MAGITDQGISIKRLGEVISDMKSDAQPIFQDLVPPNDIVDTSDSSTLGRLISLQSPAIADLWEALQQVYLAFDPNSATGVALDNLVALGGITRFPEAPTTADVYVYGNNGITIGTSQQARSSTTGMMYSISSPITLSADLCHGIGITILNISSSTTYSIYYRSSGGSQYLPINIVSELAPTANSIYGQFETEIATNFPELTTFQRDGVLYIQGVVELSLFSFFNTGNIGINKIIGITRVIADEVGSVEQSPNSITTIATPLLGWDSITNPLSANTGTDRETDEELRIRFRDTKFQRATNIIEALYSALFAVPGVDGIIIYENDTDIVDMNGVLPHSFLVIVDGGLDTDIARAIWLNRPAGIRSQGDVAVDIIDSFGYVRTLNFSRPVDVPLYIRMSLTTYPEFPQNGRDAISQALINYIDGMAIGEDVVFSRLYTPINSVPGHQVDSLEISLDGVNWVSSNVIMELNEKVALSDTDVFFI